MRPISTPFFLVFLALTSQFTFAQNAFQDAFKTTSRPLQENIQIPFTDASGNSGHLPIVLLRGSTAGPVFTIVGGVHGFEYPPIVGIQELLQEIEVTQLKGTLIVIPIANVASFYTRTPYVNPQDGINLNTAFPGDAQSTITQQLAHFITENIIPVSDVFLDIHGGDACEDLIPFVCYYNNTNKSEQTTLAKTLSAASGFKYVVSYPYTITDEEPAKYAFKQAVQDGKTALSFEAGKLGNVQEEAVQLIKTGMYNLLQEMNMYNQGRKDTIERVYLNHQTYIRSKAGGIFYSSYKAGDTVKEGDLVGHTTDEFGKRLEEYRAPNSGIILYKLATPPINQGDTVMCISTRKEEKD
ncbi:MAG: succinylglutamate desuccinylase/aspartoacylase family protein [Bacteroidota bacterium]